MIRIYSILSFLVLFNTALFAQDVRFTASASKTQVAAGEAFEVSFSVNGNGDRFTPPSFADFEVLSGPNMSSSMTVINGAVTSSVSLNFDIAGVKEGVYTIGPASIVVNGKKLTSNALKIQVVKGHPSQQNSRNAPEQAVVEAASGDLSKSLFIKASVDKTSVYQGEQLTVNYKLYTRVALEGNQMDKLPDLNGFWSQDIKNSGQQAEWRVETYQGQQFHVADIKQAILFPEHAGKLVIDPLAMTFVVRQPIPARDIMEQFFGGAYKQVQYKAKSTPVIINVKPLPEAGKPAGFSGAVGSFSISTNVDKRELKSNEALNYTLKVSGSGNFKLLKAFEVSFPTDFEKYDPKITDALTESLKGVSGSRTYTYLTIPRHKGDFTIEPVSFSYFNPATQKYITLTSESFKIKVNKGDSEANVTAFSSADKQDIKLLDKDIRYIKSGNLNLHETGERFYGSALYYLLLLIGPIIFLAGLVYRSWHRDNNRDQVKVKSREAGKIAAKHLKVAQKYLQDKKTAEFYEAIFKGIYGYLSDKLAIPYANLDKDIISETLQSKGVDNVVITRLLDTLSLCEMARYAPVTGISEQEVFDKAKAIINDIETINTNAVNK